MCRNKKETSDLVKYSRRLVTWHKDKTSLITRGTTCHHFRLAVRIFYMVSQTALADTRNGSRAINRDQLQGYQQGSAPGLSTGISSRAINRDQLQGYQQGSAPGLSTGTSSRAINRDQLQGYQQGSAPGLSTGIRSRAINRDQLQGYQQGPTQQPPVDTLPPSYILLCVEKNNSMILKKCFVSVSSCSMRHLARCSSGNGLSRPEFLQAELASCTTLTATRGNSHTATTYFGLESKSRPLPLDPWPLPRPREPSEGPGQKNITHLKDSPQQDKCFVVSPLANMCLLTLM